MRNKGTRATVAGVDLAARNVAASSRVVRGSRAAPHEGRLQPRSLPLAQQSAQQRLLNESVEALPVEFREVFVLREMEELSYKEVADVARIPIGTVMSRLSRARRQLQAAVSCREQAGSTS